MVRHNDCIRSEIRKHAITQNQHGACNHCSPRYSLFLCGFLEKLAIISRLIVKCGRGNAVVANVRETADKIKKSNFNLDAQEEVVRSFYPRISRHFRMRIRSLCLRIV